MQFNPIISDEILSPKELLDKLGLRLEDNIKVEQMSWEEFEENFPDTWTYPLSEITHLIDEGIYVYICEFDDGTIRYVEDQDYGDSKALFSKDFDISISYDQDTNTVVINSDGCTGVRYYLNDKSELALRLHNYIDYILFNKEKN